MYQKIATEIKQLPLNLELTQDLCDITRYSGILVLDGKYVKVRGFKRAIPYLYGIDYLTHDIPHGILTPAEDLISFRRILFDLKKINYPLQLLITDDRPGISEAIKQAYPWAKLQLCHVHYLENLRRVLKVRTDQEHHPFFNALRLYVFVKPRSMDEVTLGLNYVRINYAKNHSLRVAILIAIKQRLDHLFNYLSVPKSPNNTNLIELYNSHLNARVKPIKGFKTFQNAESWLNAYVLRRRTKPITDSKGIFKHLNTHASLELSIKKQAHWPGILTNLGIPEIKYFKPPNTVKKAHKR